MRASKCAPVLGLLLLAGCPRDSEAPAEGEGEGEGEREDCVRNPTTHLELINACTDATGLAKTPTLPLLNEDGSLPPVP